MSASTFRLVYFMWWYWEGGGMGRVGDKGIEVADKGR